MPNPVFDGLPDVFVETLGEPVTYTSASGGAPVLITAIWTERPLDVVLGDQVSVDEIRSTLKVRASDIASPQEGDTARREADGKIMIVSTPIHPDGKGMIVCTLSAAA